MENASLIFQKAIQKAHHLSESAWNELVLSIFRWQAVQNETYRLYLDYLHICPSKIHRIEEIPFLPIQFFKYHRVCSGTFDPEAIFESSRTTGQRPSQVLVRDISFYHRHAIRLFEMYYGSLSQYHLFALLPSYLERPNSSLISMINAFMQHTAQPSRFFLYEWKALSQQVQSLLQQGKKVIILGVTFALLEWAESAPENLNGAIIMETGGMKGRRKEMVREELHQILQAAFHVPMIHAEYGMTELFSQAYSQQKGKFRISPFLKVFLRDLYDPFDISPRKSGGINIIDLANIDTCCFIETQDIGALSKDKQFFEVLGRTDNTDIRGCNLMVSF